MADRRAETRSPADGGIKSVAVFGDSFLAIGQSLRACGVIHVGALPCGVGCVNTRPVLQNVEILARLVAIVAFAAHFGSFLVCFGTGLFGILQPFLVCLVTCIEGLCSFARGVGLSGRAGSEGLGFDGGRLVGIVHFAAAVGPLVQAAGLSRNGDRERAA